MHIEEMPEKKQPKATDITVTNMTKYYAGAQRSQKRLEELNFDPIGELVRKYWEIDQLIQYEYDRRDGKIQLFSGHTGKPLTWKPDTLNSLIDAQISVADKLLRYGYGRVPEINVNENRTVPPMFVQTTTKETYQISGREADDEE